MKILETRKVTESVWGGEGWGMFFRFQNRIEQNRISFISLKFDEVLL